ncbi:caspase family protein [Streptomyces tanashiensis]|uniref:caspase family protein n=1 Tax=Streptomyces tanashiensis TaxID=67367 RepID=UPI003431BFE0
MRLSDPSRSRAVIVGTSEQSQDSQFRSLPAVARNVRRIAEVFRDPLVWGLPADHCVELLDSSRDAVFTALGNALKEATDTVVFYFAGHGMRHPVTREFYLCLPDARKDGNYNTGAIRYADIQTTLGEPRYAVPRKVVILDSCYSAGSFQSMDDGTGIDEQVKTPGAVSLVSSDEMLPSKAPQGAQYTAYTGHLISVLGGGLANGKKLLTLQEIHEEVGTRLEKSRMPRPRILTLDGGTGLSIARNVQGGPGPVPVQRPEEEETRLGFEADLFRMVSERLDGVPKAVVGDSLPWRMIDHPPPALDGERLIGFVDLSRIFTGRFIAFSNKRIFWHAKNISDAVTYGSLRNMTIRLVKAAYSTGLNDGSIRVEVVGVEIVSDSRSMNVPTRHIGNYTMQEFLTEIREAARRHGISG